MSDSNILRLYNGHNDGVTQVLHDEATNKFVSCGEDGKVRIWENIDDSFTIKIGDHISSIAVCNNTLYVSSDFNTVEKYTFPKGEPDGVLMGFTGLVTCISAEKSKTYICAGSCDFEIKAMNIKSGKVECFLGHKAPILSAEIDGQCEFLASTSCDGDLKIWSLKSNKCEVTIPVFPRSNSAENSKTLGKLSWRPITAEDIAVPTSEGVKIISRGTWSEKQLFTSDLTSSLFQCCRFSPCGRFLASSSIDGWVIVWDLDTSLAVRKLKHPHSACVASISWNPKENNSFVFSDTRGQVGEVSSAVPEQRSEVPAHQIINDLFDKEDDFMNEDHKELEDLGNEAPRNEFEDLPDIPLTAEVLASKDTGLEETPIPSSTVAGENSNSSHASIPNQTHSLLTTMQPAFQPGSTPSYLSNRFMVWNQTGSVKCYEDTDDSAIDIEFHNKEIHHPIHMTNHGVFTMADMSDKAVILACGGNEGEPSKLRCLHFTSWDSNRDWSVEMDKGEIIQAITIGGNWIATCSDNYQVRIFSLGGVQRQLFSIQGPVVCMAGHTDQLIIVYHLTQGFCMNQCLGYILIELGADIGCKPRDIISGKGLPISKASTLTWLGFTVEGTPATCDSKGAVRILNRSFCNTWVIVSELEKLTTKKSHHFWVVGLVENPQQIRCILCRGTTYPPTLPRPVLSIQQYKLPFCELNTDKSKFEEQYWRTKLFSASNEYLESRGYETNDNLTAESQKMSSQTLMQLFALLCKCGFDFQAYEVCTMMSTMVPMNLAVKYASRNKKTFLAQKLMEIVEQKASENEVIIEKDENEEKIEEKNDDYKIEIQSGYSKSSTLWEKPTSNQATTNPPSNFSNQEKRVNPFKKTSAKLNPVSCEVNNTLDTLQRFSTNPKKRKTMSLSNSLKKGKEMTTDKNLTTTRQTKLNLTSTPKGKQLPKKYENQKINGVQLYIEENLPNLQTKNPEKSISDVRKMAMCDFRNLAPHDKENWNEKAKCSKKRKHDDIDDNLAVRHSPEVAENNQSDLKAKLAKFSAT